MSRIELSERAAKLADYTETPMPKYILTAIGALLAALTGCKGTPREVPVGELAFPVVVIYGETSAQLSPDADDLGRMRVERYMSLPERLLVIDASARVYEMSEIEAQRGAAWMMMHPTGTMPIALKLRAHGAGGLDEARGLVLSCRSLGHETDVDVIAGIRARIRAAAEMAEIIRALGGEP